MTKKYFKIKKKSLFCFLFLLIIVFDFSLACSNVLAEKRKDVSGSSKRDEVHPGESVSYRFSNNNKFEISTDVLIDLEVGFDEKIENREISIDVENSGNSINPNPTEFEIETKRSVESYGLLETPKDPKVGGIELNSNYKCVYKIQSNTTLEKIKLYFEKKGEYALDPLVEYSVAVYEEDGDSWELIDTEEKVDSSSETYLKASISDLEANKEYYITIYEVSYWSYVWIGIIIISAIAIISIAIAISKKEFFDYLKTRTTTLDKGAHRLTMEEVLENENRNKIIDLILEEPGIHFNELMRRTELAPGNLVWHLDILETYKIIGKKRVGNFLAYLPYYPKNPISNIDLRLSKSKITLDILETIESEPGIWNNIITKKFKVDHKTIHYHLKKLTELDLIRVKKEGRKLKIFPNFESDYYLKKDNQI